MAEPIEFTEIPHNNGRKLCYPTPFLINAYIYTSRVPPEIVQDYTLISSVKFELWGPEISSGKIKDLGTQNMYGSYYQSWSSTVPINAEDIVGGIDTPNMMQIKVIYRNDSALEIGDQYYQVWFRGIVCDNYNHASGLVDFEFDYHSGVVNKVTISGVGLERYKPSEYPSGYSSIATYLDTSLPDMELEVYVNSVSKSLADAFSNYTVTTSFDSNNLAKFTFTGTPKLVGEYWIGILYCGIYYSPNSPYPNYYQWVGSYKTYIFTVYNQTTPQLSVKTVTPTTWMSDDPNHERPYEGLNPYTVVFEDTSLARLENQAPQAKTAYDFDDLDSGTSNYAEVVNSASIWVKPPDQTHVFDDVDGHSVTITVTNKYGDTVSASCQFSPSAIQRIVLRPQIKHSGAGYTNWHVPSATAETTGVEPDVIECRAHVAGRPLPYVEWVLELTSGSSYPAQYGVTKSGTYAEFALPKTANYSIHCDVYRDESKSIRIGTRETFLLTVPANTTKYLLPNVADTSVWQNLIQQNDFTVWVLNAQKQRIDILTPTRIQYVQKYADADYVQFTVPKKYKNIAYLVPNSYIFVGYQGYARCMIVDEYNEGDYSVEIVAIDAVSTALSSRVATVSTTSTNGNGYDYQIAPAETLLRYFPISNMLTGDRINGEFFVLCSNQERGEKCVYSARYENIKDIVTEVCSDSGLGYEKVLYSENPLEIGMFAYSGRDYTSGNNRVVFSEDFKTAKIGNYRSFKSQNVAITAGKGEGSTREYEEYMDDWTYQFLEYIEKPAWSQTNHPYINTGRYILNTSVVTIDCEYAIEIQEGEPIVTELLLWVESYDGSMKFGLKSRCHSQQPYYRYISACPCVSSPYETIPVDTVRHTYVLDVPNHKTIIDGVEFVSTGSAVQAPNYDCYLFAVNIGGAIFSGFMDKLRIYSYIQQDNGVEVLHLLPARRYDGEVGMYDTVSNTFYPNISVGEFIAGPSAGHYIGGPTGYNRREIFVDAGDSADSTEQERMGTLELEKTKENSITVYPNLNNSSCVFGTHYKVGDLVKIITNSGLELNMRINQASYSKDETGTNLVLECGNDLRGYQALIRDNKLANAYARK